MLKINLLNPWKLKKNQRFSNVFGELEMDHWLNTGSKNFSLIF